MSENVEQKMIVGRAIWFEKEVNKHLQQDWCVVPGSLRITGGVDNPSAPLPGADDGPTAWCAIVLQRSGA